MGLKPILVKFFEYGGDHVRVKKKRVYLKFLLIVFIFFVSQITANTLPFNWTDLNSLNPPSPREFSSQAFDPSSGQIVLFGGSHNGISLGDTWVFDSSTNSWTELTPPISPSAREKASMVFDQSRGIIILFGGYNNGTQLGDTWVFDHRQYVDRINPSLLTFCSIWGCYGL